MKKIFAIIAIAATMTAVNAQAQNAKSVAAAKSAVDKAYAATENAKQNTKAATWIKYGQTLLDAFNAPAGNAWVGMSAQELAVVGGGERPMSEADVTVGGQPMHKQVFSNKNFYFNQSGQLALIEITQPVVENALDKALDAFAKAGQLDDKGQKTKEITAGLESVNSKFTDEAYNAYTLGNFGLASELFEKAVKAAGTAPLSQLDTNSIYNAGLTAWTNSDWNRAKRFFEEGTKYNYYGEDGEAYAKLADIAERLGDTPGSKSLLEEGIQKFPMNQGILIGLINYYLNSGEDTARLFQLFADAKRNEPDNASLYYVEGNARAKLGQNDEALAAYDEAIKVNPNYEWGYIGKGMHLYNRAVEIQDEASMEMDNNKYEALVAEFEKTLKGCIEPFEKAFGMVTDPETKASIAEYLKNACFRFRNENAEYQAKYDKYANFSE